MIPIYMNVITWFKCYMDGMHGYVIDYCLCILYCGFYYGLRIGFVYPQGLIPRPMCNLRVLKYYLVIIKWWLWEILDGTLNDLCIWLWCCLLKCLGLWILNSEKRFDLGPKNGHDAYSIRCVWWCYFYGLI